MVSLITMIIYVDQNSLKSKIFYTNINHKSLKSMIFYNTINQKSLESTIVEGMA